MQLAWWDLKEYLAIKVIESKAIHVDGAVTNTLLPLQPPKGP